jgi:hypothetical protein
MIPSGRASEYPASRRLWAKIVARGNDRIPIASITTKKVKKSIQSAPFSKGRERRVEILANRIHIKSKTM